MIPYSAVGVIDHTRCQVAVSGLPFAYLNLTVLYRRGSEAVILTGQL
jgi:hypothetical protein